MGRYMTSGHFIEATVVKWESEFLSIAALVLLGTGFRPKGSPEAKPVADPHAETGGE